MTTGKKRGTAALLVTAVLFVLTACSMGPAAAGASAKAPRPFRRRLRRPGSCWARRAQAGKKMPEESWWSIFPSQATHGLWRKPLADMRGAQLWEIVPEEPYTAEDIDYGSDGCRANAEQNDDAARPAIAGGVEALDGYDVIYVGFPIWWGNMPRILYTFFDAATSPAKPSPPSVPAAEAAFLPLWRTLPGWSRTQQ